MQNLTTLFIMSNPRRVGVDILFSDVGVGVTPITKGTPAQTFLEGMFFVP